MYNNSFLSHSISLSLFISLSSFHSDFIYINMYNNSSLSFTHSPCPSLFLFYSFFHSFQLIFISNIVCMARKSKIVTKVIEHYIYISLFPFLPLSLFHSLPLSLSLSLPLSLPPLPLSSPLSLSPSLAFSLMLVIPSPFFCTLFWSATVCMFMS